MINERESFYFLTGGIYMLDTNYVTLEIGKTKHIALVAHDGKKKELVDW